MNTPTAAEQMRDLADLYQTCAAAASRFGRDEMLRRANRIADLLTQSAELADDIAEMFTREDT